MSRSLYFAYGSNLHPLRLRTRIPSADLLQTAELPGYQLQLNKRGGDDSAKCNVIKSAESSTVHGALYELAPEALIALDDFEGAGYLRTTVILHAGGEFGETVEAHLYIAETNYIDSALLPFDWYLELVLQGARYHRFPSHYIEQIAALSSRVDTDLERSSHNKHLLSRIACD